MAKNDFWDLSDLYRITKRQTIPTPDPKQQAVQNPEDRAASLNDVKKNYLRGFGGTQQMYPGGVDVARSGTRYKK